MGNFQSYHQRKGSKLKLLLLIDAACNLGALKLF